jgi:hypothetical protein
MEIKPAPYYNWPQITVKLSSKPFKTCIWGRATGKTTIFADEILKALTYMPRGKILFGGLTYFHIRNKSMGPIIAHWERRGIYRNIHYFIGSKAPKKWGWKEPYMPPLDYKNCIHFFNGFVVEFCSFDRPEMARSGSFDGMMLDECTKLKKSAIDSDLRPAIRGNKEHFGHLPFHHFEIYMGSQPLTPLGDWVFEIEQLAKEFPKQYMFLEASAKWNIAILGEKWFRNEKRNLPQIVYDIEIENKRRKHNISQFYPGLNQSHCYYDSYNYNYYDSKDTDPSMTHEIDSRGDSDCLQDEPLYLSFDFGSTQNCCIVAQWHRSVNQFPIIKNFYVENETLVVLVSKFIEYYQHHHGRTIYLYGGSDGTRKNDAGSRKTYFDDVTSQLNKAGWTVELRAELHEISHMDKFQFWHKFLSGTYPDVPIFAINMNNAMETFVSMDNAPILPSEFKKDKTSERKSDQPRWRATDLSDAVDNLYYWIFFPLLLQEGGPSFDMFFLKG